MANLEYYDQMKAAPGWALKKITGGRLKGLSDIKPQWRLQKMTEIFGPVGIGWKYTIDKKWLEAGSDNQIAGFVDVSVFIKHEGEWSAAIPGTGGSTFVEKESKGLHMSDEVFKMALTDALSVAFKTLGLASDVYMGGEQTKYAREQNEKTPPTPQQQDIQLGDYLITELKKAGDVRFLDSIWDDPNFIAEKHKLELETQQIVETCYNTRRSQLEVPA